MWIGWPFASSEARIEVRLLAVLVVRAGFPEREQLGEVLDPIERPSTLRLQLGKLVGKLEQHAHGNTLYLADRQGVASLEEPPGRGGRGRIVLDIARKSRSRSHRRRWADVQALQAEPLQVVLRPLEGDDRPPAVVHVVCGRFAVSFRVEQPSRGL